MPNSSFIISDNWTISYAWTCPPTLNYGPTGMAPVFRVQVEPGVPGLTPNDPDAVGEGPWGQAAQVEPNGAEVYLKVTSADPGCRWRVVVYGSTA